MQKEEIAVKARVPMLVIILSIVAFAAVRGWSHEVSVEEAKDCVRQW